MGLTKSAPGVDEVAEIRIVDAQGNPTDPRMGLWDQAFTADSTLINGEGLGKCFVDNDARRFFIEVRDKTARGDFVEAEWNSGNVTLVRKSAGVFRSAALMFVSDSFDLATPTDCGLPNGHSRASPRMRSPGGVDHRLRLSVVDGICAVKYGRRVLEKNIFSTVKTVTVTIFGVREQRNIAFPESFWANRLKRDTRVLKEVFARYGINVSSNHHVVIRGANEIHNVDGWGLAFEIVHPPGNGGLYTDDDEKALGADFPTTNGISVFYVNQFAGASAGETPKPHIGATFVQTLEAVPSPAGPYTLAHEIGHLLMEKNDFSGHWQGNFAPAVNDQNLMRTDVVNSDKENGKTKGGSKDESVMASKRLWQNEDTDHFRQLDELFRTPLVR